MRINHNISALSTYNALSKNEKAEESSLQKLSSGLRINSAADDAAGLAISEKMKAQVNGLDAATTNAQNGNSLLQTAEGSLSETQSILQRMNELATEAKNGSNSTADQEKLQDEANALAKDLDRISNDTAFNTKAVFSSSTATTNESLFTGGVTLQIGTTDNQTLNLMITGVKLGTTNVSVTGVTASALGVGTGSGEAATAIQLTSANALASIQNAIDAVSSMRSQIGAYENRIGHAENNLTTESENLSSAESTMTDVDMSKEMTEYTKNQILVQAAESMLSQANQLPQGVLNLLK